MTIALLLPLITALVAAVNVISEGFDARILSLLLDTVWFAGLASIIGVLAGLLIGRIGVGWSIVACVPMMLPSSLMGSAWIVALGRTGPLGDWLTVFDWPIAAGAVGLRYTGLAALIFATHRVGWGPAARVFKLRNAWWWLGVMSLTTPASACFVVLFILCSADHIMPSMFLIHTYGTQVLIEYNALQNLNGAAALAVPMLAPAVIGMLLLAGLIRPRQQQDENAPPRAARLPGLAVLLVAIGVPLGAVLWRTGSWSAYVESFGMMRSELVHTIWLVAIGSLISTLIAWPMALLWLERKQAGKRSVIPWILVNLAAPPSMLALGLIDLSSRWPIVLVRDSDVLLYAAYAVRFVPLVVLMLYIAGLQRPTLPVIAAQVYDVPIGSRLLRIHWPRWRGTLITALLLSGLLIATELESSLMLTPAGSSTVGVRLYTLIHTAPDQQVSAAALAMLTLLLPFIIMTGWLISRRRT